MPGFVLEQWRHLNPGFNISLHDDSDIRDFVHTQWHTHPRAGEDWDTYLSRARGATKSDLFRVLYLLVNGGVYADWDIEPLVGLEEWVQPTDSSVTSGSRFARR